jgi:hypothetical protein
MTGPPGPPGPRSPPGPRTEPSRNLLTAALGIYALARAIGLNTLLLVQQQLHATKLVVAQPFTDWHRMLSRWDVYYYRTIALQGYPVPLPTDAHGAVLPNTWAFFPAFPFTARVVSLGTGLDFENAAVVLNVIAGAIAAVLVVRLVLTFASEAVAFRAAVLWSFFPTAFLLQVPYSEALYLCLASGVLLALLEERYGLAAGLLVAAALSRGYAAPLSAAALWVVSQRIRSDPHGSVRRWSLLSLAAVAVVAPFLWMAVAAVVTGRLDAYPATQTAWGYAFQFRAWQERWPDVVRAFGVRTGPTIGVLVLAGVLILTVVGCRLRMPFALKAYTVAAALLLCVSALPGSVAFGSLARFSFSIVTLPVVLAIVLRGPLLVAMVTLMFVGLQYLWVLNIWSGRAGIAP